MEVMIRNYKANRIGETALEKREREKLVLALFQEEGERWQKEERSAREKINKDEETLITLILINNPTQCRYTNTHAHILTQKLYS